MQPVLVFRLPVVAAVERAAKTPSTASEADVQPQLPATPLGSRQFTIGTAGGVSSPRAPGEAGKVSSVPDVPPEADPTIQAVTETTKAELTSSTLPLVEGAMEPATVGGIQHCFFTVLLCRTMDNTGRSVAETPHVLIEAMPELHGLVHPHLWS